MNRETPKTESPLFTTRSVFTAQAVILRNPWVYVFVVFVLFFIPEILNPAGLNLIYCLLFLALSFWLALFYAMLYISYRNRVYKFYPDRLEFVEGVFIRDKIKIPWHAIQDVILKKSPAQYRTPVASILMPANYQGSKTGIVLLDIENAPQIREKILSLVSEHKNSGTTKPPQAPPTEQRVDNNGSWNAQT